jgi:hypothetical protein
MRAAGMWLNDENPWKSDVKDGMPSAIRDALRIIVAEPITIETFVFVARVLSHQDPKWLANKGNLGRSPHGGTIEARVLCARAAGFDQFIAELTSVLRQPNPSQWVIDERDNFVDALINQSKSDFELGAALFLSSAIDNGLPVIDKHRILISPLSVLEMCAALDPEKGEPQDRFYTDLVTTQNRFSNHEDYSGWTDLYQMAWDRLTAIHCLANQKLLLRNAFPDQASYTEFSQYVKGLTQQSTTKQRVLGGSRTDENKAVRDESNLLGSLAQAGATGDLVSLLRAGATAMMSRAKGLSSESSEALQKRLFSVDPVEQTAILQELNRRARKPQTGLLSGAAAVGSATGILGDN